MSPSRQKQKVFTYKDNQEVIIANKVVTADTFFKRLLGLIGTGKLPPGEGLLIYPCRQVHTFFMFYPLDIIFLDESDKIVYLKKEFFPFRVSPYIKESKKVLELSPGTIEKYDLKKEDKLIISS